MTHPLPTPGMIPEEVWRVSRDEQLETPQAFTLACVKCLVEGSGPSGGPIYLLSGTSYCSGHATMALSKGF